METKCDDLLIPFVNYVFGENYDKTAVINRSRNEQVIEHEDGTEEKRITDSRFEVRFEEVVKRYHIECESSKYDGSILIRIFEYDSQIARDNHNGDLYKVRFKFPNTGLLLLRKAKEVPENAVIELEMPNGEDIAYEIPIIKMCDYTIDGIFEKKLYFLIPFYIFNFEDELDEINKDRDKISKLFEEFKDIRIRLEKENENGNLSAVSVSVIIKMVKRVAYKLTMKRQSIQEKVGDIMGGQVLDLPEFKICEEEKAKGIRIFIEDKLEDGIPQEKIIEKLEKRYKLTESKAKEWIEQCMVSPSGK